MSDLSRHMPPVLHDALTKLPGEVREAFIEHVREGTSADYLADWLRRAGHPVSATTIKRFRASIGPAG